MPQKNMRNTAESVSIKPIILVVAGVIEKQGRYLLAQRVEHASQGGLWEFPRW